MECFNGAALFQVRIRVEHAVEISKAKLLQWGRTFSSADNADWKFVESVVIELQWGRTFSSADKRTHARTRTHTHGFNGAALFQVRIKLRHAVMMQ